MLPYDLKMDKDGLLYLDDKRIIKQNALHLGNLKVNEYEYFQNSFYRLFNTNDYILKYSHNPYPKEAIEKTKNMLINLLDKQSLIPNVDFPIGYYSKRHKLAGLIVRYYQNGVSCDNIINNEDIEGLGKFYYHDEDSIHNLFLLFNDVLNVIYEMFENDVYYTDIHPGNIVIVNNKAKVIDFDYRYVYFDNKDEILKSIMFAYNFFLQKFIENYHLCHNLNDSFTNFEEAKTFTKKLENNIRVLR